MADPGGTTGAPPKGPDSFILTYKYFETYLPRELAPPLTRMAPPTGNPGSVADYINITVCTQKLNCFSDLRAPILKNFYTHHMQHNIYHHKNEDTCKFVSETIHSKYILHLPICSP